MGLLSVFHLKSLLRELANVLLQGVRRCSPKYRWKRNVNSDRRRKVESLLARFCQGDSDRFKGDVLIDGQWDNPNYWLRLTLLRKALGLPNGFEVGVTGRFKHSECSRTLKSMGIEEVIRIRDIEYDENLVLKQVNNLKRITKSSEDILKWKLEGEVPGSLFYDAILKRQRLASVDIFRSDFWQIVREGLVLAAKADRLIGMRDFKLVVVSHPVNFEYGLIAWFALTRGIKVIVPFGLFGVLRMVHMQHPEDLTDFYDRPKRRDIECLPVDTADKMRRAGVQYLKGRLDGRADDLASVYAFNKNSQRIDRASLCLKFGWDPVKPIVGFYASNWYDWPHQLGMTQFRDFLDWTEKTFDVASQTSEFNWLFKPHPCEEWFGGVSLKEIMRELPNSSHIGLADKNWNNAAVMECIDAMVTYHGTAGIEFASLGKPVLLPDRGKYHDCGFAKVANNRQHYLELLSTTWWSDYGRREAQKNAELFAGWWFCAPSWQGKFLLGDDSRQEELYSDILSLLVDNPEGMDKESESLKSWYLSGHMYSHTFKMMHAKSFQLTNV